MMFLNFLVLLFLPFIFLGVINKTKAFWGGRKGASVIQPLYDFIRLLKKGEVISTSTSFIFTVAPVLKLAAILVAGLLTPMIGCKSVFSFDYDFILFIYSLGLSRFFSLLGAMDTGSSFEGMGASREATFATIVEPALFMILASLIFLSGQRSFVGILSSLSIYTESARLIIVLIIGALFIMLVTEGCRIPVDDPNTHLELTMIHEVMVLDNSGPNLAMMGYASALKMILISSLIINLVVPQMGIFLSFAMYIACSFLIAVIIGCIESWMARLRLTHIPQFLLSMSAIGILIISIIMLKL
jgi:formate hydrogenlyase subunit 4